MTVREEYTKRLLLHIDSVREYGRKLDLPESQLQKHDLSKWSDIEFEPYAKHFVGNGSAVDANNVAPDMAAAWLHHIHHNPHHWQHWIFPDGYNPPGSDLEDGVMEMPEKYALEMVADWHGASFAYTDSWNIADWLYENMLKITVHSTTALFLRGVLSDCGYADIVAMRRWNQELILEHA